MDSVQQRNPDLQNLTCIGIDSQRDNKALMIKTVGEGEDTKVFKTAGTVDNLTFTVESGNILNTNFFFTATVQFDAVTIVATILIPFYGYSCLT